jgi:hypothetical protein
MPAPDALTNFSNQAEGARMQRDWLTKKVTVAEAESAHLVRDDNLGPDPVPFGFMNQEWQQMIAGMQPGDELWEFSSPADTWQHLCGRAGFAVVRNGNPIASIVTCMN